MNPRFYIGQPVVCVYGPWDWHQGLDLSNFDVRPSIPVITHKYHVAAYVENVELRGGLGIKLREMSDNVCYAECGFQPLTKQIVDELMATKAPSNADLLHAIRDDQEHREWKRQREREKQNV